MNLLVSGAVWIDIAFFVILLLGLFLGVWKGFIKGICKIAGTILAIFLSFSFCNAFAGTLESWFSLTTTMANAFHNETVAGWVSVILAFIILFVVIKLGSWLLGKIGTALTDSVKCIKVVNRVLGGILGLFEACVLIFLILMVCSWISADSINAFIDQSTIVSKIYHWEWFEWAATFSFIKKG